LLLEDLKQQIESSNIKNKFIIFKGEKTFIARQYTNAIAHKVGREVEFVEDVNTVLNNSFDIFQVNEESDTVRVFNCDTFVFGNPKLSDEEYLFIICKKIDKDTETTFKQYVVEIPDLVEWQIKDYLYSTVDGVETKYLDWLINVCNKDIDRIQLEVDKLLIFEPNQRQKVFQQMVEDNALADVSDKTIFDFISALVKKDKKLLRDIYEDIDSIDIEDIGVVTLLYNNFKKYIQVWMQNNPTPENTGLSSKQIWAINRLPRVWSTNQLIDIMTLVTGMDYRLKTGAIPVNMIRDYLVVNLLSR
jgi:DNA polymerase III delta subunit